MQEKSSTFLAMKAPLLADALAARDPGAPAALYDTHAESLFRYCWFILRNRDAAQLALRDALVVAEAHIGRLHAPSMLRPWLYALARSECLRRQQSAGALHDAVIARPDQPDADRRLIAWHAVMSLAADEREALELTIRHGLDGESAALVMGLPTTEIRNLLAEGRVHLEHALAGEILARHGVHGCPERAGALRGWAGEMTVTLRERLVLHAISCPVCGRYLPRNVSATKVYSLLPVPVPPQAMRLRIMTCFSDPELVGYRMFVAARVKRFDQMGFPGDGTAAAAGSRRGAARLWSGPAAAAAAVAVLAAAVFAISRLGGFSSPVQGVASAAGAPAGAVPSVTGPGGGPGPAGGSHPRSGSGGPSQPAAMTSTAGIRGPAALYLRGTPVRDPGPVPGPSRPSASTPPPLSGRLQVSPTQLGLGAGSTGEITLTADGGPVAWSAQTSSPDLTLSATGGTVQPGRPVTVTVTVSRAQDASGQAAIAFAPGGDTVTITWSSPVSNPPPPPPTATPTPTVIPPTPSPTVTLPTRPSPPPTPAPTGSGSPSPAMSPG
jgi:DNA-directed RNA polymerase specialized sigma24 family protein